MKYVLATLALALSPVARGAGIEAFPHSLSWAALAAESAAPPRERAPDLSAAIEASRSYAIPAAEIVGFDFLLNRFDKRHFGCCDYDVTARTIRRNLRSSWVVDRDPFQVNQLGHPYQGSMYHGFARASGLGFWEGLGYTFLGSAFWEIAGETTPPSLNDQVNTGVGGAFLGEALFRMANLLLEHDEWPVAFREVGAAAISPPVGFNRLAFGERFRRVFPSRGPAYFTRLQLGFSGATEGRSGRSTTRLRRDEALADFFMEYGLPGKADYEYTRPFDYFTFQATASSANGFESSFTRGMLLGRTYQGARHRGIAASGGSTEPSTTSRRRPIASRPRGSRWAPRRSGASRKGSTSWAPSLAASATPRPARCAAPTSVTSTTAWRPRPSWRCGWCTATGSRSTSPRASIT